MNRYKYQEVYDAALHYFNNDELAASTWVNKYCLRKNDDYLELSPNDMHERLAKHFYEAEKNYDYVINESNKNVLSEYGLKRNMLSKDDIFNLFKDFKYIIPGGSVMSGLGSDSPVSLSNCWVIAGPNDSIDDIFRVCNEQSQLMKRRGGVGFDISKLRPNGALVHNSAKTSTGAVSFMDLFSNVTNTIAQAGRRGALMLSISIKHPDAKEFIEKKQDLTKVTGANISLQISNEFMDAVINEKDYYQIYPVDKKIDEVIPNECENYDYDVLYSGKTENTYFRKINAKKLWDILIHCAWNTAEPGIIFQDNHHNYSPDGVYPEFRGSCTNPCGEIFMHEDSCRLIHVNLSSFANNAFKENANIDFQKLYEVTYEAMRLADDLVDLETIAIKRILKKIEDDGDKNNNEYNLYSRLLNNTLMGRRCGLGFTGLADLIAKLNLKYDSEESLSIIKEVMKTMFRAELDCQIDMSITRGTFPSFDFEKEIKGNEWYDMVKCEFNEQYEKLISLGRRNVSFNTVAPTGTVSILAKCTSGIEPLFLPFYIRRKKCMTDNDNVTYIDNVGEKYTEYLIIHNALKQWYNEQENQSWFDESIANSLEKCKSEIIDEIYKKSPYYLSTANDIDWTKRVELQGIIQHYITHSISSTINLPNDVSEDMVSTIYLESWRKKLKGITVYRDGCRSGVLVSSKDNSNTNTNKICINSDSAAKRPKEIPCKIYRFNNKGEKWVGVVGLVDGKPYEIFTGMLEKLNIPNWVEDGFIIRNKEKVIVDGEEKLKSRYDICYFDKDGYRVCVEGLSRTFNPEFWNYAKLISGLLRHRMPLTYIVKVISTLNLDDSNINTWKNGVIRTLRKFNDSNMENNYEKCPECGGRLLREGGCLHCLDCNYSKCE